jgi:MFS family permease
MCPTVHGKLVLTVDEFRPIVRYSRAERSYAAGSFTFRRVTVLNLLVSHTDGSAGLGTLFCGLAPSMDGLILARAIAGMGGGG